MPARISRWTVLVCANAMLWCMLLLYQRGDAAPPGGAPPFRNSIEQREEMVRELREIKALLKEQNSLLRSEKSG